MGKSTINGHFQQLCQFTRWYELSKRTIFIELRNMGMFDQHTPCFFLFYDGKYDDKPMTLGYVPFLREPIVDPTGHAQLVKPQWPRFLLSDTCKVCDECSTFNFAYLCVQFNAFHVYIYIQIHRYIDTYIHTSIHTSIHSYIHTFIHSYIHTSIHPYIHPSIHTYICIQYTVYIYMYRQYSLCTCDVYQQYRTRRW